MKKTVFCIVAAGIACAATLSGVGCGEKSSPEMISVYAPDGAPALALANVIKEQGATMVISVFISLIPK